MTEETKEPTKITMGSRSTEIVKCSQCGKELTVEERNAFEGEDGQDVYFCDECLKNVNDELENLTKNTNMPKAFFISLLAAIGGGAIYGLSLALTKTDFCIIAIGLGWLVATAACWGAGGKRGMKLQVLSAIMCLIGIFIAYDVFYFIVGDSHTIIRFIALLIVGPVAAVTSAGPISLIFWAFALYYAFVIPKVPKLQ